MPRALIFGIILAGVGSHPADAQEAGASLAYGRHLAQECAGCHSAQMGGGIPVIAGKPAAELSDLLRSFREGRTNPVMVSVARSLDERQIAALAAYFASLKAPDAAKR